MQQSLDRRQPSARSRPERREIPLRRRCGSAGAGESAGRATPPGERRTSVGAPPRPRPGLADGEHRTEDSVGPGEVLAGAAHTLDATAPGDVRAEVLPPVEVVPPVESGVLPGGEVLAPVDGAFPGDGGLEDGGLEDAGLEDVEAPIAAEDEPEDVDGAVGPVLVVGDGAGRPDGPGRPEVLAELVGEEVARGVGPEDLVGALTPAAEPGGRASEPAQAPVLVAVDAGGRPVDRGTPQVLDVDLRQAAGQSAAPSPPPPGLSATSIITRRAVPMASPGPRRWSGR